MMIYRYEKYTRKIQCKIYNISAPTKYKIDWLTLVSIFHQLPCCCCLSAAPELVEVELLQAEDGEVCIQCVHVPVIT